MPTDVGYVFKPDPSVSKNAYVNSMQMYKDMHKKSLEDPEAFWGEICDQFHWEKPYQPGNICSFNFNLADGPIFINWMKEAKTNICFNALDRHVREGNGNKVAFYW